MLKHEKKAFIKFFSIYFGSVALLILVSGHFYYIEQKKEFLKDENFQMLEYARMFKTNLPHKNTDITHTIQKSNISNFNISNFKIGKKYFTKYIPHDWHDEYMIIKKPKEKFNKKIFNLIQTIVIYQLFLLLTFASISYFLSLMALKPMRDAVTRLDNFSKDLIHDINTPVTSILLNMNLLRKDKNFSSNKYLERISKNVTEIHSLNTNLTILLKENSFDLEEIDILKLIRDFVEDYKKEYPQIDFIISEGEYLSKINEDAFKQIVSNILSNAIKYSKQANSGTLPYIKVYVESNTLYIEDNGIGIQEINSIFKRNYTEHKIGNGIGLDIVKRLCEAINIDISVRSKGNDGTIFNLKFNNTI